MNLIEDSSSLVDLSGNVEGEYVFNTAIDDIEIVNYKYLDLYNKNHDFIGWIKVSGTSIDYPVMRNPDEEDRYLRRDFNGEYSIRGSIFMDPSSFISSNSLNMLIYGHNMKDGSMFHDLIKFNDMEFALNNRIYFETLYYSKCYKVVSVFNGEIGKTFPYYRYSYIDNEDDFKKYILNVRKDGKFFLERVEYGDELITLSTCSYHVGGKNGRFVVVARRVDDI